MRVQSSRKLAFLLGTAISIMGAASVAQARQTTDQPSATALEEIVVTAERRSENLQKVPLSVAAPRLHRPRR